MRRTALSFRLGLGLIAPLIAASPALARSSPPPAALRTQDQPALELGGPLRSAVRWLRSQQDVKTGSYGSVEATALALRAFATSPDRYRSVDGPFVRRGVEWLIAQQAADGSFGAAGAGPDVRRRDTAHAAAALMALGEPEHAAAMAKAMEFLGADAARDAVRWPVATDKWPLSDDEQIAAAHKLLAKQAESGRWVGPRGEIAETAAHAVALSGVEALLTSRRTGSPAPAPIDPLPSFSAADRAGALKALEKGAGFLASVSDGGKWGAPGRPDAGLSAMVLAALQCQPAPRPEATQKLIDAGLQWLVSLQKPDGSIHDGKLANYTTSAAIMALARSGDERFKPSLAKAQAFLVGLQADEGEGYSEGDLYYGGIGYGSTERPDLSNLQMALEALSASGLEPNAPTYKKALKFLERCQNRSESNDLAIRSGDTLVRAGDDGGAGYAPGDSKAGFVELPGGARAPRSYGSMTYALLKCMVFAGVDKTDPRLKAAFEWVRANYTLDVNPGFDASIDPTAPYQGLFYYLHTMAQALDLLDVERLVDNAGLEHAWRAELCGRVVSMQSKLDGSWTNRNSPRWYEGNPLLGTAYALLTLDAALPK
jgi:squalene-hopene/tetraprenyl-beta-curcumene cyclase